MKLKKLLSLLAFFYLLPMLLSAQIYIGINGGGGLDNMVSLRVGVPIEVEISKTLSIQPAFTFTQQHTPSLLLRLDRQKDYRRASIAYLGFPLLLKARFTLESFQPFVFLGPQLSYATKLTVSYLEDGVLNSKKLTFDLLQINRWDFSVVAGIGIEKVIHKNCKIRFELLHLLGLTDLDQRTASAIYTEGRIFNLGLMIPL